MDLQIYWCSAETISPFPCAAPGDQDDNKYWRLLYARRQPDMWDNPKKAKYHDSWRKLIKNEPWINDVKKSVIQSLERSGFKMTKKFSMRRPFVRVCVPTKAGRDKYNLKKTDMVIRVNPNGYKTDRYSDLFYKAFVRNGKVTLAGRTGH